MKFSFMLQFFLLIIMAMLNKPSLNKRQGRTRGGGGEGVGQRGQNSGILSERTF